MISGIQATDDWDDLTSRSLQEFFLDKLPWSIRQGHFFPTVTVKVSMQSPSLSI